MRSHFIFAIILVAVFAVYGQKEPRIERRIEQLKSTLQLTDQQSKQVEQILKKTAEEAEKLREENRRKQQEMQTARLRLMDQTESQIANVLNEEQKKKFDFYRKNSPTTKRLMRLQQRLNLDADQTYKIGQILSESRNKIVAIRENEQSREARYKAMLSVKEETSKQIKALLNEDQQTEYENLQKHFWAKKRKHGKAAKKGYNRRPQKPKL